MDDVRWMKDYPYKMTVEQARAFGEDVLNIVAQIPHGRVTTYGHIAALAGWPSHSRMVGRTLRYGEIENFENPSFSKFWYRSRSLCPKGRAMRFL